MPSRKPLPPGRLGLPWLGETVAIARSNHGFYEDHFDKYGPIFKTRLFGVNFVVVSGAQAFHQFNTDPRIERGSTDPVSVEQIFRELEATATKKQQAKAKANAAKARTRDSMQAFTKLTHLVDGQRRIVSDPPLIVPIEDLIPPGSGRDDVEGEMRALMRSYRRTLETDRRELLESFEYVHFARKVVGVGSVRYSR